MSQTLAQRMFPNQDAVNRHIMWTDPVMKFIDMDAKPRRIVAVAADVDDENVVPSPAMTVYMPAAQEMGFGAGRLFLHAHTDPYALVQPVTRIIRELSADQVVEKAATLEDIRAEVLTPNKLNAVVFGIFAAVALAIAVVGVAGRAGVFSEWKDARVRHSPGDRLAAAGAVDKSDRGGRLDGCRGHCRRGGVRICNGAVDGQLFPGSPDAGGGAGAGVGDHPAGGGADRVGAAGCEGGEGRRDAGDADGLSLFHPL